MSDAKQSDAKQSKRPAAAYFCPRTGKRLVAPGVSKDVDPKNGVAEHTEPKAQKVK